MTASESGARAFSGLVQDVAACSACERMAHSHVLGAMNGPLDARILFVAEAVGRRGGAVTGVPLTRDETGRRFGEFLAVAGIDRADVFITNAVLCNPLDAHGHNRAPIALEVSRCRPFLERTLAIVEAPVVVALGRVALESLRAIEPHDGELPGDAGRAVRWSHGRRLVPMYHPSRQATLHRPHDQQIQDWVSLGSILHNLAANA